VKLQINNFKHLPNSSNSVKKSSNSSSLRRFFIQFCVQIKASAVSGDNELLKQSNTRPPVLNADSEATVEIGMANTSRAIFVRIVYLDALTFYQPKISKSFIVFSHSSSEYRSNSNLHAKSSSSSTCWENIILN
jgi:hypothetical protein